MAAFAGAAAADDVTYENSVKKIFAERCANCHSSAKGAPTLAEFDKDKAGWTKKFKGPRLDDYPSVMILVNGTDAGALMRRLEKVKKWVGSWSLKRRKELSDDELRAITAPEK